MELNKRDYRTIGALLLLAPVWIVLHILYATSFTPTSVEVEVLVLEVIAGLVLLYAIRSGTSKWSGDLKRLLDIFTVAVVVILIAQVGLAAVHITNPNLFGISEMKWHEAAEIANIIGLLIAAYGFHEFGKAPWYPEPFGD